MKLKKAKSDTEEVIPPQAEIIEADLYKRTYFGPDIPTLDLECWEEELSEVQLLAYKNADEEYKNIQSKLEEMVKDTGGEIVYNGDQYTAYQLLGKQKELKDLERQSAEIIRSRSRSMSVSKEKEGKGKRGRPKRNREEDRDYSPSPDRNRSPEHKKKKRKDKEREKNKDKENTKTKDKTLAPSNVHSVVTNVRPSENTAIGGLLTGSATKTTAIVDLTKDDGNKNVADSREVSFNKLQGKTFPSLVVVARPYLRAKEAPAVSDRASLDSKVKSVLMHTPMKFTEWLIQQGLVRSEQWCGVHLGNKLKLGMYSDISKFPYSGGYVWISECCPTRFVSVFCSSLFEGATFPPSVILKLIYHWACQTNVQNVVQWVKVDNLYVKGLFTWLRAVCTTATHQHMNLLGGAGKKVEVGVISLGTTSHDGTQRQVKVEVLGVLDTSEKLIRLRAVEPLAEHEKNYKKRFQKILEPLTTWVHSSSIILTDLTVDKGTLVNMGFKNVIQSSSHTEQPTKNSNSNIMEYLRRIVPRMFQNTLSLLSRQIIQQFLDELVWREKFGISPGQAFDNIVAHISEQTKLDSKDSITVRLNKIAGNPFKNWKYPTKSKDEKEETRSKRSRKKKEPTPEPIPKKKKKEKTFVVDDDDDEVPLALRRKIKQENVKERKDSPSTTRRRKTPKTYVDDDVMDDIPLKNIKKEVPPPETVSLERYYFGEKKGIDDNVKVAIAVECPICNEEINNNISLMHHIFAHVVPPPAGCPADLVIQCTFCLMRFADQEQLDTHLNHHHPVDTKAANMYTYTCVICEVRYATVASLATHLQRSHAAAELPYCCAVCQHRASSQRRLLLHFHTQHRHHTTLQCPHCTMVIPVYANGFDLSANVLIFIEHMKQHLDKELEVRCNRCVLKFVHLGHLKEHQLRDHNSVLEGVEPLCKAEHLVNKPKSKPRGPVKDTSSHTVKETFEELTLVLKDDGSLCRECDNPLDSQQHFLGVKRCTNCPFTSSCYRGMLRHGGYCAGPLSLEDAPRQAPHLSHCVCSYSTHIADICNICDVIMRTAEEWNSLPADVFPEKYDLDLFKARVNRYFLGTDMLTHLLMCEHKTAYSSEQEAKDNTVKPPEETAKPPAVVEDTAPAEQATESVSTVPDYAPPSVLNTQLSLDDLAPPSVLQPDQQEQELLKDAYERPLATPRRDEPAYTLGDFEPLPQEPPPQPDFEQL